MQRAEPDAQHLEAQAMLRVNHEPDAADRADLAEPIANHIQSELVLRTTNVVKLGNMIAIDQHESNRLGWHCDLDYHKNATKDCRDRRNKQSGDFKARVDADLPEQYTPDGQQ